MQLVETKKIFIQHAISLGVPPVIDNLKCIGVGTMGEIDIFEYCGVDEVDNLKNINGIYFK